MNERPLMTQLTPLERELLNYLEKLVTNLDALHGRYEVLEPMMISNMPSRMAELEACMERLSSAQEELSETWLSYVTEQQADQQTSD